MEKITLRPRTSMPGFFVGALVLITLLCGFATPSRAGFTLSGSDSLTTGSANWTQTLQTGTNARILFQNTGAEFVVTGSAAKNQVEYEWSPTTGGTGSYTDNWSVQVDVHLDKLPAKAKDDSSSISLKVFDVSNPNNVFSATIGSYKDYTNSRATVISSGIFPYYLVTTTGTAFIENSSEGVRTGLTDTTLKISFDSARKTLTSYYGKEGSMKKIRTVTIANDYIGWQMSDSSGFQVCLSGSTSGTNAISSGQAYFKNFVAATGSAAQIYSTTVSGSSAPIWDLNSITNETAFTVQTKVTTITTGTTATTIITTGSTGTTVTDTKKVTDAETTTAVTSVSTTGTTATTGTTFTSSTNLTSGTISVTGTGLTTGTTVVSGTTITTGTTTNYGTVSGWLGALTSGSSAIKLNLHNLTEDLSGKIAYPISQFSLSLIKFELANFINVSDPYADFSSNDGVGNSLSGLGTIQGTMSGGVSKSGTLTRVAMTVVATGTGTIVISGTNDVNPFTETLKFNGELDRSGSNFHVTGGSINLKAYDTVTLKDVIRTGTINAGGTFPLPEGVNGDWNLTLNLAKMGNKYDGSAVIQTTGRSLNFTASGAYSPTTKTVNLTLKGTGVNLSVGVSILGTNMSIQSFKGKLLGQSIDYKAH